MTLLLGVELLDELYSGVPSVGSAEIQETFTASYAITASALLLVPAIIALLVEPILFVLSDRYPRKWFVCSGLFAMAAAAFLAAAAPSIAVLSVAVTLAYLGSGSGVALAQATLVDACPDHKERILTRWTLLGEVGDLLGPALVAFTAAWNLGWRGAYTIVGCGVLSWAVFLSFQRFPAPPNSCALDDDDHDHHDDEPSVWVALKTAVGNRQLMFWLGAAALCDLLDEIVVVFAALHLRDALHLDSLARSMVIGSAIAGAIIGVLATEVLLRRIAPLRLLWASSLLCIVAYGAWLLATTMVTSAVAFFLVGLTAAPMYPIASAQAYAALPGRSGTVNAAGHVFTPVILAFPWVLGVIADAMDVRTALAVLLIQPLGLALVAWAAKPRPPNDR